MRALTRNLWFIFLIKLISLNGAHNQALSNDSSQTGSRRTELSDDLIESLKNRLKHFGSLRPGPSAADAEEPTRDSNVSLNELLRKAEQEAKEELEAERKKASEKTYPGAYQPREVSDYMYTNFENYMSNQKKEFLEKCTKNPHDFVLVVDESGSISSYNWNTKVKEFLVMITSAIAHVNSDNNLSIVQYAQTPKVVMNPRKINKATFPDAAKVIDDMFKAPRTHGTTYTGQALQLVRELILDPKGEFVLELSESTAPTKKKNMVVILFTDGGAKDAEKAVQESLIARFNGAEMFVFGVGSVKTEECRKLVGCPPDGNCKNFFHARWDTVIDYLQELVLAMCKDTGLNATCIEKWSDFSECSAPCGGGTKTSKLIGFTTVAEATTGADGVRGLTCEEQFRNVPDKVVECNTHPCPEKLVDVHEHAREELSEDEQEVGDELKTKVFGANGEAEDVSDNPPPPPPPKPDTFHKPKSEPEGPREQVLAQAHTQSEVNHRRPHHTRDALSELIDEGPKNVPPFRLLGGKEHKGVHVDRLLSDEEAEALAKKMTASAGTQTKSVQDSGTQTKNVRDADTQTVNVEGTATQTTRDVGTGDDMGPPPGFHEGQPPAHGPHAHPEHHRPENHHDAPKEGKPGERKVEEVVKNVGVAVSTFKQKVLKLLENGKFKTFLVVLVILLLTWLAISIFAPIFLRDKEPAPNLFDPTEEEFMNAGPGDDVEPTEDYHVSNMEDGIWA